MHPIVKETNRPKVRHAIAYQNLPGQRDLHFIMTYHELDTVVIVLSVGPLSLSLQARIAAMTASIRSVWVLLF